MTGISDYHLSAVECAEKAFQSRDQILAALDKLNNIDVVVVGGGIHGACVARQSALDGLKTVLLERGDYAEATSSRSSKMAHGGLRYLELLDFRQVFDGIKARNDLFQAAGHLVRPVKFKLPIAKGAWCEWLKIKLGLSLYELFLDERLPSHRWVKGIDELVRDCPGLSSRFGGFYEYLDGEMDDARLVLETIYAARQEGAVCLNYAEVKLFKRTTSGRLEISFIDRETGTECNIHTGAVINCAGPWVGRIGRIAPAEIQRSIRYSRGSHLLFAGQHVASPVLLPLKGASRNYWVWPYKGQTLVGTTEREVGEPEIDPIPADDEVEEIYHRLKRDFSSAPLSTLSAYYGYAGIRTLYSEHGARNAKNISRRPKWVFVGGVLSLVGGKFTTAAITAREGLGELFKYAGLKRTASSIGQRRLPGANLDLSALKDFIASAQKANVPEKILQATLARLGARITHLSQHGDLSVVGEEIFAAEIQYAIEVEQARTVEDVMRRRTRLEELPGWGEACLAQVVKALAAIRPLEVVEAQAKVYCERLRRIQMRVARR